MREEGKGALCLGTFCLRCTVWLLLPFSSDTAEGKGGGGGGASSPTPARAFHFTRHSCHIA